MNFKDFYNNKTVEEALHKNINSVEGYKQYLFNNGWKRIGYGAVADVFSKDDKNYVLKLYKNDFCYNLFLDFLEQNQDNPHIVKMKRRIVSGDTGLVALEKLECIRADNWKDELSYKFGNALNDISINNKSFEEALKESEEIVKDILESAYSYSKATAHKKKLALRRLDFFVESNLPLFKTVYDLIKFIREKGYGCRVDSHSGNFMKRGSTGQIVITDPVI